MTPVFLHKLGLDNTADERAVRRAYAVKLKQIDQERDAAGFQALRAAYEAAMRWAQQKKEPVADVPAMAFPGEAEEQEEPVDFSPARESAPRPQVLPMDAAQEPLPPVEKNESLADADAEFSRFMEIFRQAVSDDGEKSLDAGPWQSQLKECLEGDRLVNITAREIFEIRFANLLAHGWQPGHEVLFVVAAKVFGWDEDGRRLLGLGGAGHTLELALRERAVFDAQGEKPRTFQRALIKRLRSKKEPDQQELISKIGVLEKIIRQYPTWLRVITDMDQARRWRALYENLPPAARRMAVVERQVKVSSSHSGGGYWGYGFAAMLVLNALMHSCSNSH